MRKLTLFSAILLITVGFAAAAPTESKQKADKSSLQNYLDESESHEKGNRVALTAIKCHERCGDKVSEAASKRSARKGRNPQTGKEIKIPAKKVVKFKPGAELADKGKRTQQDPPVPLPDTDPRPDLPSKNGGDGRHTPFHDKYRPQLKEGRKGMNAVNVQRTRIGGDSAMGQEELTIAYDRYKRTQ